MMNNAAVLILNHASKKLSSQTKAIDPSKDETFFLMHISAWSASQSLLLTMTT